MVAAFAILCAPACSGGDVQLDVEVDPPALEGRAFPYDPVALFDSLPPGFAPRPEFPELEAAIRSFAMPRTDGLDSVSLEWSRTRDSVDDAAARLFAMDRNSAEYRGGYASFRELYSRLTIRSRNRDQLLRRSLGPRVDVAYRAQAAADSLRRWEDSAYTVLAPTVEGLTTRRVATAFAFENRRGTVSLAPGDWWITARARHPDNPFLEYFWNQPIRVSGLVRVYRVPLSPETAIIRWRY